MTTVSLAAASLRSYGIRCRRDWSSAGQWLAEIDCVQYVVGGSVLVAAAAAAMAGGDPIATLDSACR